jgi:radical SAM superfamily enzyme YgiQ (UPF0313 family)
MEPGVARAGSRLLLVRAFVQLKGGGPVPPLGLLSLAAVLRRRFGDSVEVRVLDTGLVGEEAVRRELEAWKPDLLGLSAMSCEAPLLQSLAATARAACPACLVVVGGPHATVERAALLADPNLDLVVVGEGERTILGLVERLREGRGWEGLAGVCFRASDGQAVSNPPVEPIQDLDSLPYPAWDLVDLPAYARNRSWNGTLKAPFYATIVTSRGCPYGCTFCHNLFGKAVRLRSAAGVLAELRHLRDVVGAREVHVLDDVFNIDRERVKAICQGLIEARLGLSLSFPNGLRADILTPELVGLLGRAGTYKVNFGFETASPRLQESIGKRLDIPRALAAIEATSRSGIITGAYFMMGFPSETREEIDSTIELARRSRLDVAWFFKATPYPGSPFHQALLRDAPANLPRDPAELHFYSVERAHGDLPAAELNSLLLKAQRRFFLRPARVWRGFWKAPRKGEYLRSLLAVLALVVQGALMAALLTPPARRRGAT